METTVESTDKHTVKLTIEVPPEEFAKDLDKTYRAIAREVKIPGFRPGKAPKTIIDAQVGQDVVLDEFVHASVPSYFRTAVTDEDLAPIGDPEVDVEQLELGKPFIFTATVEVRPRLELTEDDYKGVTVEKPATAATDEEVDQYVERLRRQFAELEPVGRPVKEGDFVTANVTVTRNGQQLDQLTREDYLYSVGSAEFGPVMDAKLAGTKPGDIVRFEDTLEPERFGEELAGPAGFLVMVKEVKELELPDEDDTFAKTASEFDSLQELRDDLRAKIAEAKERESVGVIRDRALQAVIDRVDVELPDSLIEDETSHRMRHAEDQASRYGLTLDQMLEIQGWDRDRLARGQPRARAARDQGRPGAGERRARRGTGRDGRGDRHPDRNAGAGLRPRPEGTGQTARPVRPDRDAGRRYHPFEGARHHRRPCRYHRGEPRRRTRATASRGTDEGTDEGEDTD